MKKLSRVKSTARASRWKYALETIAADSELSSSVKFLYTVLAIHSYDGKCSMGARLIGLLSGMSKSTVAQGVNDLRKRGHIKTSVGVYGRNKFELVAMFAVVTTAEETSSGLNSAGKGDLLDGILICPKCSEVIDLEANRLVPHVHGERVA